MRNPICAKLCYAGTPCTLTRKNIRPFADFSYKTVIFKRLEKYLKLTQNSPFVHQMFILMGNASQWVLVPKFSAVQTLQSVKIQNAKKGPFYEVKMKTSNFKSWYFLNQFWHQNQTKKLSSFIKAGIKEKLMNFHHLGTFLTL